MEEGTNLPHQKEWLCCWGGKGSERGGIRRERVGNIIVLGRYRGGEPTIIIRLEKKKERNCAGK